MRSDRQKLSSASRCVVGDIPRTIRAGQRCNAARLRTNVVDDGGLEPRDLRGHQNTVAGVIMSLAYHEVGSLWVNFFLHAIEPVKHVASKEMDGTTVCHSTHLVYLMAR